MGFCEQSIEILEPMSTGWWWLLETLVPSAPPTIAAIVGFFVFHKLALQRQKREEVRQALENFRKSISELLEASTKCWEITGKKANSSGRVRKYKSKLTRSNLGLSALITYDPFFVEIKEKYRIYRSKLDEVSNEVSRDSIEGKSRKPYPLYGYILEANTLEIITCVDKMYARRYK